MTLLDLEFCVRFGPPESPESIVREVLLVLGSPMAASLPCSTPTGRMALRNGVVVSWSAPSSEDGRRYLLLHLLTPTDATRICMPPLFVDLCRSLQPIWAILGTYGSAEMLAIQTGSDPLRRQELHLPELTPNELPKSTPPCFGWVNYWAGSLCERFRFPSLDRDFDADLARRSTRLEHGWLVVLTDAVFDPVNELVHLDVLRRAYARFPQIGGATTATSSSKPVVAAMRGLLSARIRRAIVERIRHEQRAPLSTLGAMIAMMDALVEQRRGRCIAEVARLDNTSQPHVIARLIDCARLAILLAEPECQEYAANLKHDLSPFARLGETVVMECVEGFSPTSFVRELFVCARRGCD